MKHDPLLTEALWASLEKRRARRERVSRWMALVGFPVALALLVHWAW